MESDLILTVEVLAVWVDVEVLAEPSAIAKTMIRKQLILDKASSEAHSVYQLRAADTMWYLNKSEDDEEDEYKEEDGNDDTNTGARKGKGVTRDVEDKDDEDMEEVDYSKEHGHADSNEWDDWQ
ncbi:hypothetical protein PCASD_01982 [Puccinia coronata f. sp. avenae]|uniref:Uncharacterized protein n=1 Tax=Puccinia coronata f. sp. avenae TaxID=200324 RepID=A0A2N5VHK7_9BASI|nr:hypothetical protein PCASD_01982 [Puccinia coronata f. sp. avenae]